MNIAIDTETRGLDCTKFILGCIVKDGYKKPEEFYKKEDMWKRIIELGRSERKRGKVLNVYAHNMTYDFYAIAKLKDPNIIYKCMRPFIASYYENGEETIIFLDTMSIYPMSLKKLGKILKYEKYEMPKELIDGGTIPKAKVMKYCIRDAKIVLKSLKYIKDMLNKEGNKTRRIYTINQVAISNLINMLKKEEDEGLFFDKEKGMLNWTKFRNMLQGAYRGGRVETFKTGEYNNCTYIDINSLYPHSAMTMDFPMISQETIVYKPLETGMNIKEIIDYIGVSRCIVKTKKKNIGILPIRTTDGNIYPKEEKILIGTWTNEELKTAEKHGDKIINIEWTILYPKARNPLKQVLNKLYKRRIESNNEYENWFYKQLMNRSFGKLGQKKTKMEIKLDTVEKADEYIHNGYEVINRIETNYLYKKEIDDKGKKNYYCPIIPILINAKARLIMLEEYMKIPSKDLLYTDTDSIIFKDNNTDNFIIGNNIGQFKIVKRDAKIRIYGRKTYKIGKEMKISGIRKKEIKNEDIKKGIIKNLKMRTIKNCNNLNMIGTFKKEKRDLKEQEQKHEETQKKYEDEVILIDEDIQDFTYFIKDLKKDLYNIKT